MIQLNEDSSEESRESNSRQGHFKKIAQTAGDGLGALVTGAIGLASAGALSLAGWAWGYGLLYEQERLAEPDVFIPLGVLTASSAVLAHISARTCYNCLGAVYKNLREIAHGDWKCHEHELITGI